MAGSPPRSPPEDWEERADSPASPHAQREGAAAEPAASPAPAAAGRRVMGRARRAAGSATPGTPASRLGAASPALRGTHGTPASARLSSASVTPAGTLRRRYRRVAREYENGAVVTPGRDVMNTQTLTQGFEELGLVAVPEKLEDFVSQGLGLTGGFSVLREAAVASLPERQEQCREAAASGTAFRATLARMARAVGGDPRKAATLLDLLRSHGGIFIIEDLKDYFFKVELMARYVPEHADLTALLEKQQEQHTASSASASASASEQANVLQTMRVALKALAGLSATVGSPQAVQLGVAKVAVPALQALNVLLARYMRTTQRTVTVMVQQRAAAEAAAAEAAAAEAPAAEGAAAEGAAAEALAPLLAAAAAAGGGAAPGSHGRHKVLYSTASKRGTGGQNLAAKMAEAAGGEGIGELAEGQAPAAVGNTAIEDPLQIKENLDKGLEAMVAMADAAAKATGVVEDAGEEEGQEQVEEEADLVEELVEGEDESEDESEEEEEEEAQEEMAEPEGGAAAAELGAGDAAADQDLELPPPGPAVGNAVAAPQLGGKWAEGPPQV
ncbi:hypothetical protein HYH03_003081 [Edaphochlamys debaryana]|uniref:Uncharacterized protein n=1 Tax=Edaphochlamys debaryana TaxID=47281 RepID=A0A835YHR3_9CHLO|nr:hypothetical protein HYH03_003081 [Edaphochlamys debaryana]|eukprot:KAG2498890.1 hypothetical protein HYH03_003081 [Edaphochlamys debaryana]